MPIGNSVTEPIPPVGTAGTSYASQLVAFLTEVKARLEAKVALTSLLAGLFDLDNNGLTNASYVGLYEQATFPSTPVGSLQRYGGELYYVSASGAVRITNGGGLSMTSAQGITGDYGSGPEEFRYDLGALEYYAYSDYGASPKEWARVGAQGFDIYGTVDGTTRVRLAWAGGANPSYTLTLPDTVPASQTVMQMDASGNVVLSNDLKHGTRTLPITPAEMEAKDNGATGHVFNNGFWNLGTAALGNSEQVVAPIKLEAGKRLLTVTAYLYKNTNATDTLSVALYKVNKSDGTRTAIDSNTNSTNAPGNITITLPSGGGSLDETIPTDHYYQVEIYHSAALAGDTIRCADVDYDNP